MTLKVECPRCPTAVVQEDGVLTCPMHGAVAPLRRASSPTDYTALAEHLELAGGLPSWLPWPLPLGWAVSDFGVVTPDRGTAIATFMSCGGMTDRDGNVSLTVVTEEPGVGLGARVAGVVHDDPGTQMLGRPVQTRVRAGAATVPLWLVSTTTEGAGGTDQEDPWDRAVLVGEAQGRWLWLVITPASAALGIDAWGPLDDMAGRGPELVDLSFAPAGGDW
jgi:hypothetical protein